MLPGISSLSGAIRGIPSGGGSDGYFVGAAVGRIIGTLGDVNITSLSGGFDSEPRSGDLLVVVISQSHNLATSPNFTCTAVGLTFTQTAAIGTDSTADIDTEVYYCQLNAAPPPVISTTTSSGSNYSVVVYVIRGHNKTNILDAATTEAAATSTTGANPPSITTATANSFVLAIGSYSPAGSTPGYCTFTGFPANYTAGQFAISGVDADLEEGIALAYRIIPTPATENPGEFLFSGGASGSVYSGITMAIRTV